MQTQEIPSAEKKLRKYLWVFIIGLFLSGLSAIPLLWGVDVLVESLDEIEAHGTIFSFVSEVRQALLYNDEHYPFLAYGTDWLAFAHFLFALLFVGALRDPFKNEWIIRFGMMACALIIPIALLFGQIREIPMLWRFIDCSFGVIGYGVLWRISFLMKKIQKLKDQNNATANIHSYEKPAA
jgi:hypothetical protein